VLNFIKFAEEDALISATFTQMSDSDISFFSILLSLMICWLNQFDFEIESALPSSGRDFGWPTFSAS
jgi:hypothetical protein